MIILGIDPGTARTGWGLVEYRNDAFHYLDCGCLTTSPKDSRAVRLDVLYRQMVDLVERSRPSIMVVEQLFFNRNVNTAMAVGEARGVILLAAARAGVEISEFNPVQVKEAVTGYGHASKDQVRQAVMMHLDLEVAPQPDDASDGLALALCHGYWGQLDAL